MSTSDQDQRRDQREDEPDDGPAGSGRAPADPPIAEPEAGRAAGAGRGAEVRGAAGVSGAGGSAGVADPEVDGAETEAGTDGAAAEPGRLTPRQARRLRIVLSAVGMVAMAVVLALRIASRSSVLVVGVYGLALILCGVVIELSRNGRTRLGSWLLGVGLVAAVGADWMLLP
ncbi:hypothetical protein [Streptomyces sp. NPDC049916]|uniref:hypothetical protein n=1 Tax=Streptomyces sp. NPDC049916 TaxID=3155156 RepID=UPI00342F08A0